MPTLPTPRWHGRAQHYRGGRRPDVRDHRAVGSTEGGQVLPAARGRQRPVGEPQRAASHRAWIPLGAGRGAVAGWHQARHGRAGLQQVRPARTPGSAWSRSRPAQRAPGSRARTGPRSTCPGPATSTWPSNGRAVSRAAAPGQPTGYRLLDLTGAGRNLLASRAIGSPAARADPVRPVRAGHAGREPGHHLDGPEHFARPRTAHTVVAKIVELSAGTGQLVRVLYTVTSRRGVGRCRRRPGRPGLQRAVPGAGRRARARGLSWLRPAGWPPVHSAAWLPQPVQQRHHRPGSAAW